MKKIDWPNCTWTEIKSLLAESLLLGKGSAGGNTLLNLAGEVTVTFLSYMALGSDQPTDLEFRIISL